MPPMRRWSALLLPLFVMVATAAETAEANVSASSGSSDGNSTVGLISCDAMYYSSLLYDNQNVTECRDATGFSFAYPETSSANETWICTQRACREVFQSLLNITEDCQLNNNFTLIDDVINPLSFQANCYNSTMFSGSSSGSGSYYWGDSVGDATASSSTGNNSFIPSSSDSSSGGSMTAVAIVSITIGALLAFVVVVIAVVWYKRQRMRDLHMQAYGDAYALHKPEQNNRPGRGRSGFQHQGSDLLETDLTGSSQELSFLDGPLQQFPQPGSNLQSGTLWNDEELLARHMRSEDIDDIRVIGNGGHGVVYLVRYRQGRLLASKRLVRDQVTRSKTRALITEIKLVAKLDHPNIVQFVGAAWTTEWDLQALFEYMPNGDLCTYLAKTSHEDGVETWDSEKLQIAMDIVEALVYVHSFSPPLVHRDLKSRNVLLTENTRAKLSDFGVSRFQSDNCTMTAGVGTSRWLAPEVISGGGEYNQSCDIYSMGMVLYEMDTHRLPFSDLRMPSGNPMPEVSILQLVSQDKLKPTFSPSCPQSLRVIALRCLAFDPTDRPNAIEVSYILRTIAKNEFGM